MDIKCHPNREGGGGWEIFLNNNKVFWLESYLLFVYLLGWFPWTLENWCAEGKYLVQGLTVNWGQDLAWHPGPLRGTFGWQELFKCGAGF